MKDSGSASDSGTGNAGWEETVSPDGTAAGVPEGGAESRAPRTSAASPPRGRAGTATHALRQLTCAPPVGMG